MQTASSVDLSQIALAHFRRYFYGAILAIITQAASSLETYEAVFEHFPFLQSYFTEIVSQKGEDVSLSDLAGWWQYELQTWEETLPDHLPLRALQQQLDLEYADILLFMSIGFIEEDARFASLFASMQLHGEQHRPTLAILSAWWSDLFISGNVRYHLRNLQELGLIQVHNPDAPRTEWTFQIPAILWDAVRGTTYQSLLPGVSFHTPAQLSDLDVLILPETIQQMLPTLPQLLLTGEVQALIVRGPRHNGRRTLLASLAKTLGRGVLEINGITKTDDERWRLIGPLAVALNALPIAIFELSSGETCALPHLNGYSGPQESCSANRAG